jgi:hypothetical protein
MPDQNYSDLTIARGARLITDSEEDVRLVRTLAKRVAAIKGEQDFFRQWCDRADALYYSTTFTDGGADLWPTDKSATTKGRSHVSINTPSVYVDVPAALQSVEPIENMLATDTTEEARAAASSLERVYTAWKQEEDFELKFHKATVVKALYGRTAGRVYWDSEADPPRPCIEVIEQPRNLWLGWKTDQYDALEWAAYVTRYEPNALAEQYGVDVRERTMDDGRKVPFVTGPADLPGDYGDSTATRPWLDWGKARIEVWDYWYRKPVWRRGKLSGMVTVNAVIAGNYVLRGPIEYPEHKGELPYVILFNTFIPGVPTGRSELHDAEHLIREKYEKVTAGSQMIANAVAGDYWQLVGPEAPTRVPAGLKPKRNELVGPGPGNRIETITPFIAQFQLEQYLGRLDRELSSISGLNDLLLGLAPAQVLSSSKAINALIANYESRLSLRRKLLYKWRRDVWSKALTIWKQKDAKVRSITDAGAGFLDITDPSLNPRDEMETATRAANLVNAKLWSQRRAMDAVGVDDPETEQDLIREERTDATMFPESVQVMAQLMGALQSLGLAPPQGAAEAVGAQATSGQRDLAAAGVAATPQNTTSSQLPGDQGIVPPEAGGAPEGAPPPFAAAGQPAVLQGMVQGGEAKGRILTQQKLGRR